MGDQLSDQEKKTDSLKQISVSFILQPFTNIGIDDVFVLFILIYQPIIFTPCKYPVQHHQWSRKCSTAGVIKIILFLFWQKISKIISYVILNWKLSYNIWNGFGKPKIEICEIIRMVIILCAGNSNQDVNGSLLSQLFHLNHMSYHNDIFLLL